MRDPLMRSGSEPAGPLFATSHARASDPPTSRAAAATVSTETILAALLDAYRAAGAAGLTDEEAATAAGLDPRLGAWKRCSDLRALGMIQDTGTTRKGTSGRARIVCVAR